MTWTKETKSSDEVWVGIGWFNGWFLNEWFYKADASWTKETDSTATWTKT